MLENLFNTYLPHLINLLEGMGIIILLIGAFTAFFNFFRTFFTKKDYKIKLNFANSLVTCLDFKLAAEILKIVIIKDLDDLILIGTIFILRIIMTFVLEREIRIEEKK